MRDATKIFIAASDEELRPSGLSRRELLAGIATMFALPAALLKEPAAAFAPLTLHFVATHTNTAPVTCGSGYARVAVTSSLANWAGSTDPVQWAREERKYYGRARYWRRYHRRRLGDSWQKIMGERL